MVNLPPGLFVTKFQLESPPVLFYVLYNLTTLDDKSCRFEVSMVIPRYTYIARVEWMNIGPTLPPETILFAKHSSK